MNWQRARSDEKKNKRKDAIYNAALTLFKENGYDAVSFNGIAAKAGFTKSNMYRYFSSKEEIFLNVFANLFESWVHNCLSLLQTLNENENETTFAKTWKDSLVKHPKFLDLTPLLFISLEKNSSFEELLIFKRLSMKLLYGIAIEIGRIYPDITIDKAFQFLTLSFASMSNYWAAMQQSDALKKIYDLEEFQSLVPNFEQNIIASAEIVIRGIRKN